MNKRLEDIIERHTSMWAEVDYNGNGVYTTQVDSDSLVEDTIRDVCSLLDPIKAKEILEYYGYESNDF